MTAWSASRLKTASRCLRKYLHEYLQGIDTGSTPTLDFGTAAHRHMENGLLRAMGAPELPPVTLTDPYEQARLDALMAGYEARWGEPAAEWRVLGAEVPFEYELGGAAFGSHKGMDGLVQKLDDGKVYVLEHKTTGADASAGSAYFERLALDHQVTIYLDAATALGYEVAGVIYDVLVKPRHEPKKATPEADRTFTKGKGCKVCGGKASGVQGSGKRIKPQADCGFTHEGPDRSNPCPLCWCPACNGSGWEEPPRLHANQRDRDETPDEFYNRILTDIASRPDDYYSRPVIVRTPSDMERCRASILDTIKLARAAEVFEVYPMNPDACHAYNSRCPFWTACTGVESIDDRVRFPLRTTR